MQMNVVVTGCSSGFGKQLSEQLARRGDRVFATMRGVEGKNAGVARELASLGAAEGLDLHVVDLDVSSTESVDAAAKKILEKAGAPDVVVNNAGQMFMGITEAFTDEELSRQLDINVVGTHRVNRAFLPAMRQQGRGLIVNLSSIAGRLAVPFFGIYHASKWAIEGYSLALRAELASSGVDVVVVEPGPFTTALFPISPRPADTDGRIGGYIPAVRDAFAQLESAFDGILSDPNAPTNPGLVVERIIQLADMRAGTRPFRSVVGVDAGVTAINDTAEAFDAAVLGAFGMTAFATLAPSS